MIDLGVLEPGSEGAHLRRRRGAFRRPSRLGAATIILALALLLAGEAGPDSASLRPLSSLPFASGAQYLVEGDTAFIAEVGPGGNRVSGYDLATGHRRWTTAVAALSTLVSLQSGAGVLVATMYAPGLGGDHTVALDEATGRVLWRNAYSLDLVLPGGRALLAHAYAVDSGPVARQGVMLSGQLATSVEAVDLRTGATAWSYRLTAGCQHAIAGPSGAGTGVAVLCPSGDLRMVDLATGRTRRSATVPPIAPGAGPGADGGSGAGGVSAAGGGPGGDGGGPAAAGPAGTGSAGVDATDDGPDDDPLGLAPLLSTVGDRVLVGAAADGVTRLMAYDAGTLRPAWSIDGTGVTYGSYPCGRLLCLSDDRGLTVLDPATGRQRWHTPEHVAVEVPGTDAGATDRVPALVAGELLVQPLGDSTAGLVAAGTGRPLLDLDHWQSVAGATPLPIFARWPEIPDGRVWFGVLGGSPLTLHTIGFAPDVLKGQCRAFGTRLICETLDENLRVWSYRPPPS